MERYVSRSLIYSLLWAIAGDGKLKVRQELGEFIRGVSTVPLPSSGANQQSIVDFEVSF
jgi:dynein heavy chain 1